MTSQVFDGDITITGDICTTYGQLGCTEIITSGTDLDQAGSFPKFCRRYIVTPTANISFTLGAIGNPVRVGYECQIKNNGNYNIIVREGATSATLLTLKPSHVVELSAQASGSPDTWEEITDHIEIQENGVVLSGGPHHGLNVAGSGFTMSSANGLATLTLAGAAAGASEYLASTSQISTTDTNFDDSQISLTPTITLDAGKKYVFVIRYEAWHAYYYSYTETRVSVGGTVVHQQYNPFVYQFKSDYRRGAVTDFVELTGISGSPQIDFVIRTVRSTGYLRNPRVWIYERA